MLLFELFQCFFLLGAFSFGGGMASMELIRSRVVSQYGWLTNSEFTDIISIAEMTPGPLGINIASFTGTRVAGIPGTIVATLSYVAPAVVIVICIARIYYKYRSLRLMKGILKGLHPAVTAMVLSASVKLAVNAFLPEETSVVSIDLLGNINYIAVILAFIILFLLQKKKLGPIQAILTSGIVGAVIYGMQMIL